MIINHEGGKQQNMETAVPTQNLIAKEKQPFITK
jgi:hypothetical protein